MCLKYCTNAYLVLTLGTFQTTIYLFSTNFQKQFILHLCIPFTQHSSCLCTHVRTCVACMYVHMYCITYIHTYMESVAHTAWVTCHLSSVPALYSKYVHTYVCIYIYMCAMAEWGWGACHTSPHTCQHEDRLWLSLCTHIRVCVYLYVHTYVCTIVKLYMSVYMLVTVNSPLWVYRSTGPCTMWATCTVTARCICTCVCIRVLHWIHMVHTYVCSCIPTSIGCKWRQYIRRFVTELICSCTEVGFNTLAMAMRQAPP